MRNISFWIVDLKSHRMKYGLQTSFHLNLDEMCVLHHAGSHFIVNLDERCTSIWTSEHAFIRSQQITCLGFTFLCGPHHPHKIMALRIHFAGHKNGFINIFWSQLMWIATNGFQNWTSCPFVCPTSHDMGHGWSLKWSSPSITCCAWP